MSSEQLYDILREYREPHDAAISIPLIGFFVGQVGWELEGSTSDIAGSIVYMYTSYHLEIHIES